MVNLETKNSKNAIDIWHLDSSATKHVSRYKFNFKGLENSIKIYNIISTRGQIHGVHGKGKIKLSLVLAK